MRLDANPSPRAAPGAGVRLVYATVIALVAVLLLEGAFRLVLVVTGRPQSPQALAEEMRTTVGGLVDVFANKNDLGPAKRQATADYIHPYVGFEVDYGMDRTEREVERFHKAGSDPHLVEILLLGGSVAGRFFANRTAFEERLLADPLFEGRKVRVISHARGAFKQPQQATFLAYLFALGYRPHIVINIDGFNEVALSATNLKYGVDPLYPVVSSWGRLAGGVSIEPEMLDLLVEIRAAQNAAIALEARARRSGFRYSAVVSQLMLAALRRHRDAYLAAHERYVARMTGESMTRAQRGLRYDEDAAQLREDIIQAWKQCSLSIHAMCKARGIPYVHILQPTLHDPGAKIVTEAEQRAGAADEHWHEAVGLGYPRLREEIANLRTWGIKVADLSRIFADVDESIYIDSCHFEGVGHEIFARAIADALLDALRP